jgi:hypothetical protein
MSIEFQKLSLGRDGYGGDGRDHIAPVTMIDDGSLAPQKPALMKEHHAGVQSVNGRGLPVERQKYGQPKMRFSDLTLALSRLRYPLRLISLARSSRHSPKTMIGDLTAQPRSKVFPVEFWALLVFRNSEGKKRGARWDDDILLAINLITHSSGVDRGAQLDVPQLLPGAGMESYKVSV